MTWTLLNSKAYQKLSFSSAKALPYFLGKVKVPYGDGQKFKTEFTFSYPEAQKLGFSYATFSKAIKEVISHGFIDPVERGGLKGYRQGYNRFRLSRRWEKFGTPVFEWIDWETFTGELETGEVTKESEVT